MQLKIAVRHTFPVTFSDILRNNPFFWISFEKTIEMWHNAHHVTTFFGYFERSPRQISNKAFNKKNPYDADFAGHNVYNQYWEVKESMK